MNNRRYIVTNKRKNNTRKNSLRKNKLMLFVSFILIVNIFLAIGMVANAKDNSKPLYKYYKSYMVEKNDTLWTIANDMNAEECSKKQINECINEMISINSLDHKGTICYGNYIIVPYYSTEYR